ncbi:MAG: DUF554 domain-containing protein [Halanaerobiaceae bacterium]
MIGTIVNTAAIIIGGSLGTVIGSKLKERYKSTAMQGLSLAVLLIGFSMALDTNNVSIIIFSLLLGGLIGEFLKIEARLQNIGHWFEKRLKGQGQVAEAFVQTSLIYCVGAMAIMGAIQDGLINDPSTLYAKSMLDGFTSIAFSSTLGIGVILSAIPVFLYQGSISLLAGYLKPLLTDPVITEMTATGGMLIVAIGINLLEITKIKVGNLLPAIFVAVILASLF